MKELFCQFRIFGLVDVLEFEGGRYDGPIGHKLHHGRVWRNLGIQGNRLLLGWFFLINDRLSGIQIFYQLLGDLVFDIVPLHDIKTFQADEISRYVHGLDKWKIEKLTCQGRIFRFVNVLEFIVFSLGQKMVCLEFENGRILRFCHRNMVLFHRF